jgi:putative flippase GtrA
MAPMQPTATSEPSGLERRLEGFRDHPALGLPVRFYLAHREQVLYLIVGAWNTLFGYGIWALLQFLIGEYVHYLVVVLIAWPIALMNAYLGYRYVVFRSRAPILHELPRFSIVYVVTLIANLVLLPIALAVLPFNIYIVQALLLGLVIVGSYLANKYYSFGGGRARSGEDSPIDRADAGREA